MDWSRRQSGVLDVLLDDACSNPRRVHVYSKYAVDKIFSLVENRVIKPEDSIVLRMVVCCRIESGGSRALCTIRDLSHPEDVLHRCAPSKIAVFTEKS
jgi:hypothetical protein